MSNKLSISPDVKVEIALIDWCTSHTSHTCFQFWLTLCNKSGSFGWITWGKGTVVYYTELRPICLYSYHHSTPQHAAAYQAITDPSDRSMAPSFQFSTMTSSTKLHAKTPIHLHKLTMPLITVSGPGGSAVFTTVLPTDSWSCCLKDRARLSSQWVRYCDRK